MNIGQEQHYLKEWHRGFAISMKDTQLHTTQGGIIHDILAFFEEYRQKLRSRRAISRSGARVSLLFVLCLATASLGSIQANAQQEEPEDPTVNALDEEQDEGGNETTNILSRRGRNQQIDGPIGSHQWVNAGFTSFIDVRERPKQPDQDLLDQGLRLLTTDDFPPFNYRGEEDLPQGYHVELVRALCEELNIACTLKLVAFEEIPTLISDGRADAAIAGIANQQAVQDKLAFTKVYLKRPGRFVRKTGTLLKLDKTGMDAVPVAVRGGSAHEAYLRTYFPKVNRVPVTDMAVARQLLEEGKVQSIFGDAFQLLPLVTDEQDGIAFAGKPYYDAHFFGEGMSIAYGRDRTGIRTLLNYGLLRLAQKGRLAELYASHFAVDIYAAKD